MDECPTTLLGGLCDADADAVRAWWSRLDSVDRDGVSGVLGPVSDAWFTGVMPDDDPAALPSVELRPFLAGGSPGLVGEWEEDFRAYLVEHPEVLITSMFPTWHVYIGAGPGGQGGQSYTIWADWDRVAAASWMLPPSEQDKAGRTT